MGIEDRDYYRENFAKKQGMRYDARTARYHPVGPPQRPVHPPRLTPAKGGVPGADWHWSLKLVLWLVLAAALLALMRYFGR